MTYDLRRLRLHGIIERIPQSHRYQLTPVGLRIAFFFSRTYARLLRPRLAEIMPQAPLTDLDCGLHSIASATKSTTAARSSDWLPKLDAFELHFVRQGL
jgi:hypothetical protein